MRTHKFGAKGSKLTIFSGKQTINYIYKNFVNFGPLTKKLQALTHPKSNFPEDSISAPKGCCPSKFYMWYRMAKACRGRGSPEHFLQW